MLRLDCTNTELLNKFEEIKTENVFNNDLKKLFNTENYEEEINDDVYLSFKRNLHFDNKKGSYEIRLPFKDYSEILPDNNNLAKHRPSYLKNRLSNNNDLFNEYDKIIKDYIKEDIEKNWRKLSREDCFLLAFAKLDRALSKVPPTESFSELSVTEHTSETRNSSKPVKVKLPELVIKKFNGNIVDWQSFWDQFSSAIHQKD